MSNIVTTMTLADESLTRFASNVSGSSWTLTETTTGDGLAHRVTVRNDSANDHSGKTVPLVGTNADGKAQTETLTLPAGTATVTSTKFFETLETPLVPSATIGADTMDVGIADEAVSNSIRLNCSPCALGAHAQAFITGTINYTLESTADPFEQDYTTINWLSCTNADLVSETTSKNGDFTVVPYGFRWRINSYSSGATLRGTILN